ncbi:hypothetical protein B0187_00890 [Haemophilus paracuniculus]|uniref:Uncharacterized protein n=1 Tax=Haemophilus paracuniculus TaxID=734 RepID=A0A1T0AVP9_9PAST|nr:hypothetical protein [Haemophilus paracuniculus]OOS00881.1 hypothetical protein B0187_00890 [Haemophilus paracuniculus]
MKRHTLFQISPHNTDVATLKQTLSAPMQTHYQGLFEQMQRHLGQLVSVSHYVYRITNTNYLKVRFTGVREEVERQFYVQITLIGYTEFPALDENATRANVYLTDTTDAFWLIELLKADLAKAAYTAEIEAEAEEADG